ncbi:hypothetical protein HMPREF0973_01099 [Prevotella veroralis F0319]|uniref:Uncharacterized protein n=1 Tax=Prevotella veroralis F0319 TaxID=649761 RepID=C9MNB3_9BACT|nr:hypothetical protein HMPREF0973_01099 [Prevotella veroralis F0319]
MECYKRMKGRTDEGVWPYLMQLCSTELITRLLVNLSTRLLFHT